MSITTQGRLYLSLALVVAVVGTIYWTTTRTWGMVAFCVVGGLFVAQGWYRMIKRPQTESPRDAEPSDEHEHRS